MLIPLAVVTAVGAGVIYATVDVDRISLGRSLAAKADLSYFEACDKARAKRWQCTVEEGEEDTYGLFDIQQTNRRCWTARLIDTQFARHPLPRAAQGCIGPFETAKGWVGLGPDRYDAP